MRKRKRKRERERKNERERERERRRVRVCSVVQVGLKRVLGVQSLLSFVRTLSNATFKEYCCVAMF